MRMRLGKTLVAIRSITGLPVLVVCPIEGMWAWKRELGMENRPCFILRGTRNEKLRMLSYQPQRPGYYIVNFESIKSLEETLKLLPWDTLIIDESRRMANPKNVCTRILQSFPRTLGQRRMVLCGEPAPESPLEYFEQLRFVYGKVFGCANYWQFRNYFFHELAPHEWVLKKGIVDRFKKELHELAFFMDWKEAGLKDRKIREVRTVQLPPKVRKIYEGIKEEFVARLEEKTLETKWLPVQYGWLQQVAGGWLGKDTLWEGKVKVLQDLLVGELRSEQVVVWFKFNAPLAYCVKALAAKGIQARTIMGDDPRHEREKSIDGFRAGRIRVLLCQIKCAKTAIDLSNSSTAIYFSNSASNEDRKQSEARISHPFKKKSNLYIDLITEDTVEEDVLEALHSKRHESAFYWNKILINKLKGGTK